MWPLLLVARDWFDVATGIAQMITALAIVAAVVVAASLVFAFRAAARGLAKSLEGAQGELIPLLQQARAIADDVKGMTSAAAAEVARVRALVEQTTTKAETALATAERRLRRLDALAGIVQDEAEQAVVSVASTVRGTTAAVQQLRQELLGDAADPDEDDLDDEALDDVDDVDDVDDETGDDRPEADAAAPAASDPTAEAPRIRHRRRR